VAHHCLGGDDTEFVVSLLIALQQHRHHLLSSLDQPEVLLLRELKTSQLVVKNSNIPERVGVRLIFNYVCLVTEHDAAEELSDHLLAGVINSIQNLVCLLVQVVGRELQLVGKVFEGVLFAKGLVAVVITPII
jgi:hypothetical protein